MFRKHLAAALSALLVVAACAPCARAQSGRRFARAEADKGLAASPVGKSDAAKEEPGSVPAAGTRTGREFDLQDLNAGRSAPVVYAEDGDGRTSTKAKLAAGALFAYLIFFAVMTAASDGYAPTGSFERGAGLRR